ncbi:response regulator transcription factor [Myxococcota bacterium]|nr:response regulator transcription factor [Myxococcota bacterium]
MKVLLADDHVIFRQGLRAVLDREDDIQVMGEAANGDELLSLLEEIKVDVVILDLEMPVKSGFAALSEIHEKYPDLAVLVLSFYSEEQYALRAIKNGASGYLCKTLLVEDLIIALRKVARGERYLPAAFADKIAAMLGVGSSLKPHESLSEREFDVFTRILQGASNKEIAAEMHISPKTISTYRTRIYKKLGVSSQAELFTYARGVELV